MVVLRSRKKPLSYGVTLFEVVVASAILILIMLLVVSMLVTSNSSWLIANLRMDIQNSLDNILSNIRNELTFSSPAGIELVNPVNNCANSIRFQIPTHSCISDVNHDNRVDTTIDLAAVQYEFGRTGCDQSAASQFSGEYYQCAKCSDSTSCQAIAGCAWDSLNRVCFSSGLYNDYLSCKNILDQTSCNAQSTCTWSTSRSRCFTPACIGDFNQDAKVDLTDLMGLARENPTSSCNRFGPLVNTISGAINWGAMFAAGRVGDFIGWKIQYRVDTNGRFLRELLDGNNNFIEAKVIGIGVNALSFCQIDDGGNWFNTQWLQRKRITINKTRVVGNLANFPVLISLANDNDLRVNARSDGFDILFTAEDKLTKLDHEIERFDPATGTLVAWVRIPFLCSTRDTKIYMYYGNSGSTPQQNSVGVWDSNYLMVHHLEESGGAIDDSTSKNIDGVNSAQLGSAGAIGTAAGFNGTSNFISLNQEVNLHPNNSTISWFMRKTQDRTERLFSRTNTSGDIRDQISASNISSNFIRFVGNTLVNWNRSISANPVNINDGNWHYFSLVFGSTGPRLYIDGAQSDDSNNQACCIPGASAECIYDPRGLFLKYFGYANFWANWFTGSLDEVRISDAARSDEWILTEYNNWHFSDFYSVGSDLIQVNIGLSTQRQGRSMSLNSSPIIRLKN